MTILIVGGTGVLSSAVVETALTNGYSVTVINRGRRKIIAECETIISDRHDYPRIANALKGRNFDVVIDFLVFNRDDAAQSYGFFSQRCDQYILVSSCFVYDFSRGGVMCEDSPRGLSCWRYSGGKCEAEDMVVSMSVTTPRCHYTIVRPFVTYGDTRIPYSLAPAHGHDWTMILRALAGKPIITWDGGKGCCNIMRVEDFCTGLFGLLKNEKAYGEAINICGDETPSWKDVIDALEAAANVKIPLIDIPKTFVQKYYPRRKDEIAGRSYEIVASNEKLKRLVPTFQSTISLREGIKKTVLSYLTNKYDRQIDWEYDASSDAVINAWFKFCREKRRLRFINYLGTNSVQSFIRYLNGYSNPNFGFRVLRKCLNVGARSFGGLS